MTKRKIPNKGKRIHMAKKEKVYNDSILKSKQGFVYAIRFKRSNGTDIFKIGYSNNVEQRLQSLRKKYYANELTIELLINTNNPKALEMIMHSLFFRKNIDFGVKRYGKSELFKLVKADIDWMKTIKEFNFPKEDDLVTYYEKDCLRGVYSECLNKIYSSYYKITNDLKRDKISTREIIKSTSYKI